MSPINFTKLKWREYVIVRANIGIYPRKVTEQINYAITMQST